MLCQQQRRKITCTSVPSWLLMRTHSCPVHSASWRTRLVFPPAVGPCNSSGSAQLVQHALACQLLWQRCCLSIACKGSEHVQACMHIAAVLHCWCASREPHLEQDGVPAQLHSPCEIAQVPSDAGRGHKAAVRLLRWPQGPCLHPELLKQHAWRPWGAVWGPQQCLHSTVVVRHRWYCSIAW